MAGGPEAATQITCGCPSVCDEHQHLLTPEGREALVRWFDQCSANTTLPALLTLSIRLNERLDVRAQKSSAKMPLLCLF